MAKQQFKAESQRLLDLMINSIYTHREIFLREIISNASDAMDKLAYTALTDDKVGLSRSDYAVTITRDDTGEIIYVSGLLPPNHHIQEDVLLVDLDAGDYPCTATFTAYDEEQNEVGMASAKITVTVLS